MKINGTIGLGDVVSFGALDGSGYRDGTVCQLHKDGTVDVFRPYTHVADFSCAGSGEVSRVLRFSVSAFMAIVLVIVADSRTVAARAKKGSFYLVSFRKSLNKRTLRAEDCLRSAVKAA